MNAGAGLTLGIPTALTSEGWDMWELHLSYTEEGSSPLRSSCLLSNQQKGGAAGWLTELSSD